MSDINWNNEIRKAELEVAKAMVNLKKTRKLQSIANLETNHPKEIAFITLEKDAVAGFDAELARFDAEILAL